MTWLSKLAPFSHIVLFIRRKLCEWYSMTLILFPLTSHSFFQIVFFFCGATAQIRPIQPRFEVSRSQTARHTHTPIHTHTHTHTLAAALPWTSDQIVEDATTYTTHNKHKKRTSLSLAGFEPAIPAVKRLQTYALDRTAIGIGFLLS